ncbi:TBC1 domain family member 22B [Ischnura elegans]|uniref:TBC1 domain family member 22B n=1 Tax=Ischnura elegans TaxID=197161 RepID=UPI001ED8BAF5|nr:TBC1 domain family member 22B [Ischnura elegans]XP_046408146.1 TBC1 domain family member 22B [Ischnura elegans]XP_046408152.1 TBC1 domain family member 22B [Ischnura elegans]
MDDPEGFLDFDSKSTFWKKTSKAVPGRPSPKKDAPKNRPKNSSCPTSFQDFQESVSDAWDIGDDEFCIGLPDVKISKKVAQSAALSVINSHRAQGADVKNASLKDGGISSNEEGKSAASGRSPGGEVSTVRAPLTSSQSLPLSHDGQAASSAERKVEAMQRLASQKEVPSSPVNVPANCAPSTISMSKQYPGRPQPMRTQSMRSKLQLLSRDGGDSEGTKLERFTPLLESTLLNLEDLRHLSWSGIPVKVRAVTWRLLSGYLPANLERRPQVLERKRQEYWGLVKQYYDVELDEIYMDTYRQIHIDIPRMSPLIALFQQKTVQEMFERILFIWSIRHPASGYVQGINDLVTPFYVVFLQEVIPSECDLETCDVMTLSKEQRDVIEADSFWCLSKFLDGIQDNYIFAQLGIQQKVNQLKELMQRIDAPLHRHLAQHGVDYLQFSFRWMNNLLTRELPLHCTIRLWDTYLAESDGFASFQLYVCAAFLLLWRKELLLEKDFQGLMLMLQNLPTTNWTDSEIGMLVADAYRLKYTFSGAPNHLNSNNSGSGGVVGDR